jgi:regulation of enolase protein 1 (concanavalin A-like superfamily)
LVFDRLMCTSCHNIPAHFPAKPVEEWSPEYNLHGHSLDLLHKHGVRMALRGWGVVFDPDDDCKFAVGKGDLTITVPGKDHALGVERGVMNAPRVLQEVEGDFIVQVRVAADFPKAATSVVEGRRPFHGAGLLILQDNKNFVRLESAGMVYDGKHHRYAGFEMRQDGKFVREGEAHEHPLTGKDQYLRLERRDGKIIASVSADGIRWNSLDPLDARLGRRVLVGVAAGQNTSTGFAPQFSGYRLFREAGK